MDINLYNARTIPIHMWFFVLHSNNIRAFGNHLGFDTIEANWAIDEIVVSFSNSTDEIKHEDILHVPLGSYMYTFNGDEWLWIHSDDFRNMFEQLNEQIDIKEVHNVV